MKKYKSLIFRELKLSRKHYLGVFALIVIFAGLMLLSIFVSGREAVKNGESLDAFALAMSYMFAIVGSACIAADSGVFKEDMNSGWRRYSYALPVTAFEKTVAKYAVKIIAIIIGMAVIFLGSAAIFAAGGSTLKTGTVCSFFLMLDFFLIFDIVFQAFILRAEDTKSLKKLGSIAGIITFIVVFILPEFIPEGDLPFNVDAFITDMETMKSPAGLNKYLEYITIPDVWGIIGIVLTFVILALGFVVTLKSYERRES